MLLCDFMHGNEGTKVPRTDRQTCLNGHSESDLVQEILLLKEIFKLLKSYLFIFYTSIIQVSNFGLARGFDLRYFVE